MQFIIGIIVGVIIGISVAAVGPSGIEHAIEKGVVKVQDVAKEVAK